MWICNKCETYNNDADEQCCVCNSKKVISISRKPESGNKIQFTASINDAVSSVAVKDNDTMTQSPMEVKHESNVDKSESEIPPSSHKLKRKKSFITEDIYSFDEYKADTCLNNLKKQRKLRKVLIAVNAILLVINVLGIPALFR